MTLIDALTDNAIAAVEIGGNRLLALDDNVMHQCGELQGKSIALSLTDLEQTLYCHPGRWGIRLSRNPPARAIDATISGRLVAMLNLAMEKDSISTSMREQVSFHGNVAIAQQMQKIITEIDIDWEEILSHYTGDVLAYQIHRKGSQLAEIFKQGLHSLAQTSSEYLREEARMTPCVPEFDHFQQQVSSLRQDVDRAEARLRELRNRVNSKSGS